MTQLKTEEAALDAEAAAARTHGEDLQSLRSSMEGDREKKIALMESIRVESARLEEELENLIRRQKDYDAESGQLNVQLQSMLTLRAETEASKTRSEREAQEKNKDILNMERACALLSGKRETTALEERQIIDKLWESYNLTPGTAPDYAVQIESAAAGSRRVGELKRKIGGLGTPIASLASLITLKLYLRWPGARAGKFLLVFTLANVAGLVVLLAAAMLL
jgi:chromosome segregation protein